MQRLGKLAPTTLQTALKSDDAAVRKTALLVSEAARADISADVAVLLNDPDARVRLTALRALSSSHLTPETAAALLAVLPKLNDDWSKSAAVAAASSNPAPVIEAALAQDGAPSPALIELATSLAAALAEKQDGASLARVVIAAARAGSAAAPLLRSVLTAAASKPAPATGETAGLDAALKTLLASSDIAMAANALPFAAAWSASDALKTLVAERINAFLPLIADGAQPDATRSAVVLARVRARAADARIVPAALGLLQSKVSDALLLDTVAALAATGDPALGKPLTAALDALEAHALKPALLGPARLSKLRLHPDAATAKRALKLIDDLGGGTNPRKNEIIASLLPQIEGQPGDAAKGKTTFAAACAICHKFNGEGKEAGWGGGPEAHQPAMKVTIEHTDGARQVVELFTGDVFIDYPSGSDVPGSKRAEGIVKQHHVRYFSLPVEHRTPVARLILESYKNGVAPTTLAITADNDAPKPRGEFTTGSASK